MRAWPGGPARSPRRNALTSYPPAYVGTAPEPSPDSVIFAAMPTEQRKLAGTCGGMKDHILSTCIGAIHRSDLTSKGIAARHRADTSRRYINRVTSTFWGKRGTQPLRRT